MPKQHKQQPQPLGAIVKK